MILYNKDDMFKAIDKDIKGTKALIEKQKQTPALDNEFMKVRLNQLESFKTYLEVILEDEVDEVEVEELIASYEENEAEEQAKQYYHYN